MVLMLNLPIPVRKWIFSNLELVNLYLGISSYSMKSIFKSWALGKNLALMAFKYAKLTFKRLHGIVSGLDFSHNFRQKTKVLS